MITVETILKSVMIKWYCKIYHYLRTKSNITGSSIVTWFIFPSGAPEFAQVCTCISSVHVVHFVKLHVDIFTFEVRDVRRHDWLSFGSSCFFKMLFVFTDIQYDFHVRWCSCRLIVTRRVAHMGKKLIILPGDLS